ncbi:MAG TPA: HAD family hydrolase [Niastella sp.]
MLIERIDTLIFDLDNTLIDRNAAMRKSLHEWLSAQGHKDTQLEAALDDCMQYDNWGYTNRPEFSTWLLQQYGNKLNKKTPHELQHLLHVNNSQNVKPDLAVQRALQTLGTQYQLVLATNGGSKTQRAKIQQAQLENFFQPQAVFVSGEMEFEKPDTRYFKIIIDKLQLDVTKALVIGDNLHNDIQAANECGLYTCWVSHGREGEAGIQPTITIKNIIEITAWSKLLI